MKSYKVTCWKPPPAFGVPKEGDKLQVTGNPVGNKVRAQAIKNLSSKNGSICNCDYPPQSLAVQELVGKAINIVVDSNYISFDLIVQ